MLFNLVPIYSVVSTVTGLSVMLDISFQVKETFCLGKLLRTHISKEDHSDALIQINDLCSKCNESIATNSDQKIQCFLCKQKFHTPCLTYPIPSDFTCVQSKNPCLWWFCATCVASSVTATEASKKGDTPVISPTPATSSAVSNESANTTNQVGFEKFISSENQADVLKTIFDRLDSIKSEISNEITSKISVLENKFSTVVNPEKAPDNSAPYLTALTSNLLTEPKKESSSQATPQVAQPLLAPNSDQVKSSSERLVIFPKDSASQSVNSERLNNVKRLVEGKLKNSPVIFLNCNENNKKVTVGFPTIQARDDAATLINPVVESFGFQSRNANKMLPKITIQGVSSELMDDCDYKGQHIDSGQHDNRVLEKKHIVTKIFEKNPEIKELHDKGHTFEIVYLNRDKKVKNGIDSIELILGIKISPLIHQFIYNKQDGSIFLGNCRYTVSNRFHIKQCYHCQILGHTSADCNEAQANKPPVCMFCMGTHRTGNCPNKKNRNQHSCARCLASPHGDDAENAKTHNAG